MEKASACIEEYDDRSIAYASCDVLFSGEVEIKARIEYCDGYFNDVDGTRVYSEEYEGVFVYVDEQSYPLIPVIAQNGRTGLFLLDKSDEVDRLIAEEFGGKSGIIDNCTIVIRDIYIWFRYTSGYDMADFVELIKD